MHLVIQGLDIATTDLKALAKLTQARTIEQRSAHAFVLVDAHTHPELAAYCATAQLDFGVVPEARSITDFKLLVMDMDSTLITMETIDELADMVGIKPQVAAITAEAMRGEIDYDESLRRRLGLLKGLDASALDRVYAERLQLSPGALRLLTAARNAGIKTLLVSGGFSAITERLQQQYHLDYTRANVLTVVDGKLTGEVTGQIVNAATKRETLLDIAGQLGVTREQVIGVGDGANDLLFLAQCGVSVAYHAKPVVRTQTTYAINHAGLDGLLCLMDARAEAPFG